MSIEISSSVATVVTEQPEQGGNYSEQPALIVTISSDVLYPPVEQKELAAST
ncbi:hypothetical protein [Leptolyngbya sp. NIES-2104]|uniref:hypothetical protein n=1 Tax=Leptolyngbya sp. NIES-2104 TaxID=1552121 RepID=UPI0006EC8DCD|nr:hypothetical protein [Leptolyngbya sp. NIES-2104]GAP94173.1 hypothetical protein NIES2104_06830 [Leptolyngbya sp. NIES-2104]